MPTKFEEDVLIMGQVYISTFTAKARRQLIRLCNNAKCSLSFQIYLPNLCKNPLISVIISRGDDGKTDYARLENILIGNFLYEIYISFSNTFRFILNKAWKIDQGQLRPRRAFNLYAKNVLGEGA